jgi:hypothetical protein
MSFFIVFIADCMVIMQIMENIARINILYFHNFNDSALPKFAQSKQNQGRDGHSAFGTSNIKKILPDRFRPQFEHQKYVWQASARLQNSRRSCSCTAERRRYYPPLI